MHHHGVLGGGGEKLRSAISDPRVRDGLEGPPALVVRKGQPGKSRAVERTVRPQDAGPEPRRDRGQSLGAGRQDLASQRIGVHDGGAVLCQAQGDG